MKANSSELIDDTPNGNSNRLRKIVLCLFRVYAALNNHLWSLYRICGRVQTAGLEKEPESVALRKGQVFSLTKTNRVKKIIVRHGNIWLTTTPANGDVILRPGDEFDVGYHHVIVVEALNEAEVYLFKRPGR